MGYPTPIRQNSIASTCYPAGGMPLAFMQEDFLVLSIYLSEWTFLPKTGSFSNLRTLPGLESISGHIICSTEMCKKLVHITILKHSLNIMVALHATTILKILYFHNIFYTRFILKSGHFIWSQLQRGMKSLNYVLEFNSSKNFEFNTPQIWTFLLNNVQRFSTMQYHDQAHHHCYFLLWSIWPQKQLNFGRRIHWILWKTEHHENPLFQYLSLFKTLSSKWNNWYQSCSYGLLICISKFKISTFIWKERTSYKNSSVTEYFTLNPGQYPKISFSVTLWKHSLNIVKH